MSLNSQQTNSFVEIRILKRKGSDFVFQIKTEKPEVTDVTIEDFFFEQEEPRKRLSFDKVSALPPNEWVKVRHRSFQEQDFTMSLEDRWQETEEDLLIRLTNTFHNKERHLTISCANSGIDLPLQFVPVSNIELVRE